MTEASWALPGWWPRAPGGQGLGGGGGSPDETSPGDDLGVAVIDCLSLETKRVALHTSIPWEDVGSTKGTVKGR